MPGLGIGLGLTSQRRRAGAWSPASLSGQLLWLNGDGLNYTTSGGSTLATADGDLVKRATDSSPAGNNLLRATGAGAVLRVESGRPVLSFEGGYLNLDVSSGSVSAFALHAMVKLPAPSVNTALLAFGTGSAQPFIAPQWVLGKVVFFPTISSAGSGEMAPLYAADNTWRVLSVYYSGTAVRTFLDGGEIGPAATGTQAPGGQSADSLTRAGYGIGKETSFNNAGSFRLAELCYYESPQDPVATASLFSSYFRSRWSALLNTADPQVVWVGNSLCTSQNVSEANAIPYLVGNASSKVNRWVNASRPSITTTQMLTRVSADYATFAVTPTPKVAVIWEGTNDIAVGGVSAATAYANLVSLAQNLKASGYGKVVMGTVLPRSGLNNTTRGTLNTSIRGNTTDWDATADVAADATIGADGANTNATYYAGDQVHLIAAGNAIAAPIFRTAIDGLLP